MNQTINNLTSRAQSSSEIHVGEKCRKHKCSLTMDYTNAATRHWKGMYKDVFRIYSREKSVGFDNE